MMEELGNEKSFFNNRVWNAWISKRNHVASDGARAGVVMEGLIEKVGLFAMEKQSISVEAVKENFSIGNEQANSVIKQLETIGLLDKRDANGYHKVMMDKDAFLNRVRGYQDLAERMRAVSASKNLNLSDVTISKTLITAENDHAVKTRVPGTWGKDAKYIWFDKSKAMDIHGGKTMLTFIDKEKDYKIYDEENRIVSTMKGEELYAGHYDKVESAVREHYERNQTKEVAKTQTTTKTTGTRKR